MQKIFFRGALAQCGIGALVIALAFIGSFLIREARSFVNPASGPGASGVLGPDVGVIGNPTNGITGADTLFKGQKAISDKQGDPSNGIPGAATLFQGQKAIKDAIGGGKVYQSVWTTTGYNGSQVGGLAGADAKCQAEFGSDFHFARSFEEWAVSAPGVSYRSNYLWVHNDTLNCNLWTDGISTMNSIDINTNNGTWQQETAPFCSAAYYLACTNK